MLIRKSCVDENSSIAAKSAVGEFFSWGRAGLLRMEARRACSRPSWDCGG